MEEKFQKIKEVVEKELSCSAHNIDHVMRVYNLCLHIGEGENIDWDVLKASALLHDIARIKEDNDSSGEIDHALSSSEMASPILKHLGFSEDKIKHIQDCIISHRYRNKNNPETKESRILFDADKLDTIGAIGLARSFVWVGKNNAKIYMNKNVDEYINENLGGDIRGKLQDKSNHAPHMEFKTKLKFLQDKLYTKKSKDICKQRLNFYKKFLDRLEKEVNGEL